MRRVHLCDGVRHQSQGRFGPTVRGNGQYCHRRHRTDTVCSRHLLPVRLVQAYTMLALLARSILSTSKCASSSATTAVPPCPLLHLPPCWCPLSCFSTSAIVEAPGAVHQANSMYLSPPTEDSPYMARSKSKKCFESYRASSSAASISRLAYRSASVRAPQCYGDWICNRGTASSYLQHGKARL